MRLGILFFVLFSTICTAQLDSIPKENLKIGLVLSGGGAKGFAHIGVLKVLEEAGVRVDYIGGTSMGAIIGALYASGYSAAELDSIVNVYDFNVLMQDDLPRKSKSLYQKENEDKYALSLPITNRSVGLPTALSKGQNVFNLLTNLTEHVHQIDDFSQLPIPFFCIATDLETGKQELLEKGFLPEAIKASGAFPSLLDPVEINGKLLADGAIANNYPVEEMRLKDVDLIIGVDVQDQLNSSEDLNSAPKILMQIVSFQMYDDMEEKKRMTDVYLHPNITKYSVVSFDQVQEIIKSGVKVADERLSFFRELATRQSGSLETVKKVNFKQHSNQQYAYNDFNILELDNYTKRYILGKIGVRKEEGISYAAFNEGINRLAATNDFKSIQYRFLKNNKVELSLKENRVSTFLQISAHFDDLFKTSTLLNITSKHVLLNNDKFSVDLILGDNIRYNLDYFIDNGLHWSYGINTRHNRFEKAILKSTFQGLEEAELDSKSATKYNDFTTQLYVQSAFSNAFALRLGAENKYLRIFTENFTNNQSVKNFYDNNAYINAFAEVKLDTYDKFMFPKKGFYLTANYKAYLFSYNANGQSDETFNPFTQLKGKIGFAYTFGEKFTTHIVSEAGVTIGENNLRVHNFHLGGNNENFVNNFTSFFGYDVGDLSNKGYLKSTMTLRYELFEKNYISFTANAARIEESLISTNDIFNNTKTGYAAGYSLESFLGPIEIKYSWSPDTSQNYWFFNIGFWF